MSIKRLPIFVAIFLLSGLPTRLLGSNANEFSIATLKGIDALSVIVENLPDGAKVVGLSTDMIQTDVELKLRLAGMRVVTPEEDLKLPGMPTLYVRVNLLNDGRAVNIEVNLEQGVLLKRNGQSVAGVTTWNTVQLMWNPYPAAQPIRDSLKDLIDEFVNDWLSVNPKK